ncbi:MAG: enoyl-CoA hydratase/isomerase family protein [Myxococcota bacterium]
MSTTSNDLLRVKTEDRITTLTMNNPKRLNGWTMEMLTALRAALEDAAQDTRTGVVVLTGSGRYYSAGVNLSAVIKPGHPAKLHAFIEAQNRALFEMFLKFPKPIIAAVQGPAIGASVTTATLCDALLASERATFSTPFAKLGVVPEGCSSVTFARMFGEETAQRILGEEGWQPTGAEAAEIGLATKVVPHEELLAEAYALAKAWLEQGRERTLRAGFTLDELVEVNARESKELADAFLGTTFLRGQFDFLWSRGKYAPAMVFLALLVTRPAWALLLP